MDGVHDMGGMDGFGKVEPEPNEPVFHEDWEGRVMAMNRAMGAAGAWNIDMARFSREALPPDVYLSSSYYERWQLAMEQLLLERGLVGRGRARRRARRRVRRSRWDVARFTTADVARVMSRGSFERPATAAGTFCPGRRRARAEHPPEHAHAAATLRARSRGHRRAHPGLPRVSRRLRARARRSAQWLYTVCFEGRELWGDEADPTVEGLGRGVRALPGAGLT